MAVHGKVEVWKQWKRFVSCKQTEKLIDTNSIKNKTVTLKGIEYASGSEYASGPLPQNTKNQQIIKNDTIQNEMSNAEIERVDCGHPDTGTLSIAHSGEECKGTMKENLVGDKLKDSSGWCDDSSVCTEHIERNFSNLCKEDSKSLDICKSSCEPDGLRVIWTQTAEDLKDGDRNLVDLQSTSEITDKRRAEYDRNQGVCTGKTFSADDKNVDTGQEGSTVILTGISAVVTEGRGTINDVGLDGTVKLNTYGTDVSNSVEVTYSNVGKKMEIVENRTVAGKQEIIVTTTERTGFFELFRSPVLRKYNLTMIFVW